MTTFFLACAGLVLLSGLFYLFPRRRGGSSEADLARANLEWYRLRQEELAETGELARLHSDVSGRLAAKRRRAVRVLQKSGLGTRDIAELLELSQQRVSQIARGTR